MTLDDSGLHRHQPVKPSLRIVPIARLKDQLYPLLFVEMYGFEWLEHASAVNSFNVAHYRILWLLLSLYGIYDLAHNEPPRQENCKVRA